MQAQGKALMTLQLLVFTITNASDFANLSRASQHTRLVDWGVNDVNADAILDMGEWYDHKETQKTDARAQEKLARAQLEEELRVSRQKTVDDITRLQHEAEDEAKRLNTEHAQEMRASRPLRERSALRTQHDLRLQQLRQQCISDVAACKAEGDAFIFAPVQPTPRRWWCPCKHRDTRVTKLAQLNEARASQDDVRRQKPQDDLRLKAICQTKIDADRDRARTIQQRLDDISYAKARMVVSGRWMLRPPLEMLRKDNMLREDLASLKANDGLRRYVQKALTLRLY